MRPSLLLAHDFPPVSGGIARLLGAVAHHAGRGRMIVSTGMEPYTAMWDAACTSRIERVPGVARAEVSLEEKSARVEYETGRVTRDDMKRAIVDAGFEAE